MGRNNEVCNKELKKKGTVQKHLIVQMVYVPVARDQLLNYPVKGMGDIAAATLTITPERLKKVDFAAPYYENAKEVVVTGPNIEPIKRLEDLSGKSIYVRKSSSYFESLTALIKNLRHPASRR